MVRSTFHIFKATLFTLTMNDEIDKMKQFINGPGSHMVLKPLENWSVLQESLLTSCRNPTRIFKEILKEKDIFDSYRLMSNHLITSPDSIGGKVVLRLTSLMNGTG